MTIRYSCEKCESVLKIRDELAGSNAKCPKCKTAFVIPSPAAAKAKTPKPATPETVAPAAALPSLPMVDMPQEITPLVNPADTDLLDIAREAAANSAAASAQSAGAPKPSIADLMREHEASKKKKTDAKQKNQMEPIPNAPGIVTSGSAADVLNRNYDQKRGQSNEPPPLTREEKRAAEQKEAIKEFAVKGGVGVAGLAIVLYFFMNWVFSESYPDLFYVSGVVTLNNQPMVSARVEFAPTNGPGQPPRDNMQPSSAYTDASGKFVLYFNEEDNVAGVLPGLHNVSIMTASSAMYPLPASDKQKTVTEDTTIDFKLTSGR